MDESNSYRLLFLSQSPLSLQYSYWVTLQRYVWPWTHGGLGLDVWFLASMRMGALLHTRLSFETNVHCTITPGMELLVVSAKYLGGDNNPVFCQNVPRNEKLKESWSTGETPSNFLYVHLSLITSTGMPILYIFVKLRKIVKSVQRKIK